MLIAQWWIVLFLSSLAALCDAQTLLNQELEGPVGMSNAPYNWQMIPYTDPACLADSPDHASTDVLNQSGPDPSVGLIAKPIVGTTSCSGLRLETLPTVTFPDGFKFHEGIMQTVSDFTPGEQCILTFYQAVTKQMNCIDTSGAWSVYLDATLIHTSVPSISHLAYNDKNVQWETRAFVFTPTNTSHTLKFLPWDDDANVINSYTEEDAGLRMGIDGIYLRKYQGVGHGDTICSDQIAQVYGTGALNYAWATVADPTTIISTNDTLYVSPATTTSYYLYTELDTNLVTVKVNQGTVPESDENPKYLELCRDEVYLVNPNIVGATYSWQDGSTLPTYTFEEEGSYWLEITVDSCSLIQNYEVSFIPCESTLIMPNVFSPNDDGINDRFLPQLSEGIELQSLLILNRWGERIYETDQFEEAWDGTYNGQPCAEGVYFWLIHYKNLLDEKITEQGFVQLQR